MNNFLYNYNYKANALLGDELEERKELIRRVSV